MRHFHDIIALQMLNSIILTRSSDYYFFAYYSYLLAIHSHSLSLFHSLSLSETLFLYLSYSVSYHNCDHHKCKDTSRDENKKSCQN